MTDRFLRYPEVVTKTGFSRPTIERMVVAGTFPRPRQIGLRAIAWLESELTTWMHERPLAGGLKGIAGSSEPSR